jgi:hypothetical protein
MKNKLLLFLIVLIFASQAVYSQTGLKYAPGTLYVADSKADTFLISEKPVTNREYIIYLVWLYNVYGIDYPENAVACFPALDSILKDLSIERYSGSATPFSEVIMNAPPVVKYYIFNPKYIDYPVTGLTWLQEGRFCKWLSDRYNEYKLIKLGYLKPDAGQFNEECFVTESYLMDMYFGMRNREESVKWSDRMLIPAFRLPTSAELNAAAMQKTFSKDFKPYPMDTACFLNLWNKWELKVTDSAITLIYSNGKSERINATQHDWRPGRPGTAEMTLDINVIDKGAGIANIFEQNGQFMTQVEDYDDTEKDSTGHMPFIFIGEKTNREPILIQNYFNAVPSDLETSKYYFFRYAGCIKPGQFRD